MGVLSSAAKNTNNYLSPLNGIDNREKSAVSSLLCNFANYTLEKKKLHNRNKSEDFILYKGNSVNSDKYFEMKRLNFNSNVNNNSNNNNELMGVSSYIKHPICHRRNMSDITEAFKSDKNNNIISINSVVDSSNLNNMNDNFEVLDNKNNLFNVKSRRMEKKNLYNPKYNER